jgi:hypothetical protein
MKRRASEWALLWHPWPAIVLVLLGAFVWWHFTVDRDPAMWGALGCGHAFRTTGKWPAGCGEEPEDPCAKCCGKKP